MVSSCNASANAPPACRLPQGKIAAEAIPLVRDLEPARLTMTLSNESADTSTAWTVAV